MSSAEFARFLEKIAKNSSRVMLLEQIYRSLTIIKGKNYAK